MAASIPSYPEETLREDYELGITEGGKFYVHYKGRCTACKFTFEYSHEHKTGDRP